MADVFCPVPWSLKQSPDVAMHDTSVDSALCGDGRSIAAQSVNQTDDNDMFQVDASDALSFSSASDSGSEPDSDSEDEPDGNKVPGLAECAESVYSSDDDSELFSDDESDLDPIGKDSEFPADEMFWGPVVFEPVQLDSASPSVLVETTEMHIQLETTPIPENTPAASVPANAPAPSTPTPTFPEPPPLADGMHKKAPTLEEAKLALYDLITILKPRRKKGPGFKDPNLNPFVRERMEGMMGLLSMYTNDKSRLYAKWIPVSQEVAIMQRCGETSYARRLRTWTRQFIQDRKKVPTNPYGKWNKSQIEDEELSQELLRHLQSLGPNIKAADIVKYLNRPDVRQKYQMKKGISEQTARKWLQRMGFHWTLDPKGQYVDGHERPNVVDYRQMVYIPRLISVDPRLRTYSKSGEENTPEESDGVRRVVVWYHDESVFYAHDRRKKQWIHQDAGVTPYKKGEGHSLMVADFVSADYGWLCASDGRSAHRLF